MQHKLAYTACAIVPAAALAGAHWFPWKRVLCGHDLPRLAAYAIGTGAIVGTAATAIANTNADKEEHTAMLVTATVAAGGVTVIAWLLDAFLSLRADAVAQHYYEEIANGRDEIR